MKKIIFFLLLGLISSCNKNQPCDDNKNIREIETANITQTLIDSSTGNCLPICSTLKKLNIRTDLKAQMKNIDFIITIKLPPKKNLISQNTDIFIEKLLLETNKKGKLIFNKKDSLNFIEQNWCLFNYHIPKEISKKIKTISLSKLESQKVNVDYFMISIPIFSRDNKRAYIEIDNYSKVYRHGESYYLEKIGKKWRTIHVAENWSVD